MRNLKVVLEEHGEIIKDYLQKRANRLSARQMKGENEFETIWNCADNEGRKRELLDTINDIDKIITKTYERNTR